MHKNQGRLYGMNFQLEYLQELQNHCRKRNCRKSLVEYRQTGEEEQKNVLGTGHGKTQVSLI